MDICYCNVFFKDKKCFTYKFINCFLFRNREEGGGRDIRAQGGSTVPGGREARGSNPREAGRHLPQIYPGTNFVLRNSVFPWIREISYMFVVNFFARKYTMEFTVLIQSDKMNMAMLFWYLVKSDSSVCYCYTLHYTITPPSLPEPFNEGKHF